MYLYNNIVCVLPLVQLHSGVLRFGRVLALWTLPSHSGDPFLIALSLHQQCDPAERIQFKTPASAVHQTGYTIAAGSTHQGGKKVETHVLRVVRGWLLSRRQAKFPPFESPSAVHLKGSAVAQLCSLAKQCSCCGAGRIAAWRSPVRNAKAVQTKGAIP